MKVTEVNEWFVLLQKSPESMREYLLTTFWLLIFLLLLWGILKILFNEQFKELYKVIGTGAKKAGEAGKVVITSAVRNLELPEPYPKVTRFFAIIFMMNGYAASFTFFCFFIATLSVLVLPSSAGFWERNAGVLFLIVLGYFAWFFFAQAEKDRVQLFKKK